MNHECSICFEHIDKNDVFHTGICIHVYHNECMCLWYQKCPKKQPTCPLCRIIIKHSLIPQLKKYLTFHEKITIIINDFKNSTIFLILNIILTLLLLGLYIFWILYMFYNPILPQYFHKISYLS